MNIVLQSICALLLLSAHQTFSMNRGYLSNQQIIFKRLIKQDAAANETKLCEILEEIVQDPIYLNPEPVTGIIVREWIEGALDELQQALGRMPNCAQETLAKIQQATAHAAQRNGSGKATDESKKLLDTAQAEIERLRKENVRLSAEFTQLQQRTGNLISRDELNQTQASYAQLQQQLDIAQKNHEQLRKELTARPTQERFNQLEAQVRDLLNQLAARQNLEREMKEDLKKAQQQLATKPKEVVREVRVEDTKRIDGLQKEIAQAAKNCQDQLTQLRTQLTQAQTVAAQCEQKTQEAKTAQNKIAELNQQLAQAPKPAQLKQLQERIAQLESVNAQANNAAEALRARTDQLEEQLKQVQPQIEGYKKAAQNAEARALKYKALKENVEDELLQCRARNENEEDEGTEIALNRALGAEKQRDDLALENKELKLQVEQLKQLFRD